jgi:hypothetical protein
MGEAIVHHRARWALEPAAEDRPSARAEYRYVYKRDPAVNVARVESSMTMWFVTTCGSAALSADDGPQGHRVIHKAWAGGIGSREDEAQK